MTSVRQRPDGEAAVRVPAPDHPAGDTRRPDPSPPAARRVSPMRMADLDAVMAVEGLAFEVPWTRGNFVDSIAAGHAGVVLTGAQGELLGYFVAMEGVEELHLLNLTVHPAHQRRGHARFLLDELAALARRLHARELWLEVRRSNLRAQAVYRRHGFVQVGVRKAYYPLPPGSQGREDAVVMSLKLPWSDELLPQEVPHGLE